MAEDQGKVAAQLAEVASIHQLFERCAIDYWLFGGWAVDFHVGRVTRSHDDIDIAVWRRDLTRIATLLEENGWTHVPQENEDGYTGYERANVRLELAFLARADEGRVYTPLRAGQASWPDGAFANDVGQLGGVSARVIARRALVVDKSEPREDLRVAAKDRADLAELLRPR
jgi:hypothetical protein